MSRSPSQVVDPILCGARHGLFWLVAANGVGLLLSVLLLVPDLGLIFGEWTYGRWLPLHLNWHLYGWVALPLVAWAFSLFPESTRALARAGSLGIWVWSICLVLGGLAWLSGHTSGKIFLDWSGALRVLFPAVILFLWGVLAALWWKAEGRSLRVLPGLLVLLAVPFALYFAADPAFYPAVDRSTGGPTGASLLNSTLSVVFLLLLLPRNLRRNPASSPFEKKLWLFFVLNLILGVYAETLPPSHHHPGQIACLGSLLIWTVLLPCYYARQDWRNPHPRWRRATFVWFGILVLNGFLSFLPGILDVLKFTDGLVAHSHLAMAGFTTSFLIFILQQILPRERAGAFDRRLPFYSWHLATAGYVVVMLFSAISKNLPDLWAGPQATLYGVRSSCGLVLTLVSFHWWKALNL